MKICYFNGGIHVPTVRQRLPFFELLEQRGHQCANVDITPSRYEQYPLIGSRLNELISQTIRRWQISEIADDKHDCVVLETEVFQSSDHSFEKMLRRASGRLVYELDHTVLMQFPDKAKAISRFADRVIVANQTCADWALQFNDCVTVMPACMDLRVYTPSRDQRTTEAAKPVVGWIGSDRDVSSLSACAEALRAVAAQREFELRIVSEDSRWTNDVDLDGIDVTPVESKRSRMVAQIQQFDVAIVPLPEDDLSVPYRSNARLIELMGVGVPTIVSSIGIGPESIESGTHAMIVEDQDQWIDALSGLLDSPSRRAAIGQAASDLVLDQFTVQSRIDEYERVILGAKFQAEKIKWHRPQLMDPQSRSEDG